MTSPMVMLDSNLHRLHGWKRHDSYSFTAQDVFAPIVFAEIPFAMQHTPMAFVTRPEGGYKLVAVLGLHNGENLYLNTDGRWRTDYIPNLYRGYPFAVSDMILEGKRVSKLCFYKADGLYRENPESSKGEERFFDDEGKPTALLQKIIDFLGVINSSRVMTQCAVDALESAGLITPFFFQFENPNPQLPMIQGFFRIDEKALIDLKGPELENLNKANALAIAYSQLLSMARLNVLRYLYDLRHPKKEMKSVLPGNLDTLFGNGQDDTINFDWLK